MIRYSISKKDLEARIETVAPGWLQKAAKRTEEFRNKGFYEEKSAIWSDIKQAYMEIQGCKCIFCERKLESVELGKIEQDVEHFRPKSNIRKWKIPKHLVDSGIKTAEVPSEKKGYYLLPYNIFNYAASCKTCNSVLKKDYFPIAGEYELEGEDPKKLAKEKPLLIYPIGNIDSDPEELIKFYGVSPQPVADAGYDRARAMVTIEFFSLDDEAKRKHLMRGRAIVIVALFPQLLALEGNASAAIKKVAKKLVEGFTSAYSEHSNCARCFKKLFETDRAKADAIFEKASDFIDSIS